MNKISLDYLEILLCYNPKSKTILRQNKFEKWSSVGSNQGNIIYNGQAY